MLLVFHRHGIEHLGSVNLVCLKHLREQGNPLFDFKSSGSARAQKKLDSFHLYRKPCLRGLGITPALVSEDHLFKSTQCMWWNFIALTR